MKPERSKRKQLTVISGRLEHMCALYTFGLHSIFRSVTSSDKADKFSVQYKLQYNTKQNNKYGDRDGELSGEALQNYSLMTAENSYISPTFHTPCHIKYIGIVSCETKLIDSRFKIQNGLFD